MRFIKPAIVLVSTTGAATLVLGMALIASSASAKPPFVGDFQELYPDSLTDDNTMNGDASACQICHVSPNGGNGWNGYGWAIRDRIINENMLSFEAILDVEDLDSDLDPSGSSNLLEILSDTQPGWTDGPNNTIFFDDGPADENQSPPADILGDMDPVADCPADLNGDGTVGPADLANVLDNWGPNPGHPADINGDGEVGPADLAALLDSWGVC